MSVYKYILRGGTIFLLPLAKIAFTKLLGKGKEKPEQNSTGQNSEEPKRESS